MISLSTRLGWYVSPGDPDECWPWPKVRPDGYGSLLSGDGRTLRAHRAAWEVAHGEAPPADMCVCHSCDNRRCVNPAHLWLGTRSDNNRDRMEKGRSRARRKLTFEDAEKIRARYQGGGESYRSLAGEYGVSQVAIQRIIKGATYKGPNLNDAEFYADPTLSLDEQADRILDAFP